MFRIDRSSLPQTPNYYSMYGASAHQHHLHYPHPAHHHQSQYMASPVPDFNHNYSYQHQRVNQESMTSAGAWSTGLHYQQANTGKYPTEHWNQTHHHQYNGHFSHMPIADIGPFSTTSSSSGESLNNIVSSTVPNSIMPPVTVMPPVGSAYSCSDASIVSADEISSNEFNEGSASFPGNHTSGNETTRPPQARSPFSWLQSSKSSSGGTAGRTRTKDKYRVVYTDSQRVELEKEFVSSKYITIRRKSQLAEMLGLSERQVKIWFQNRRAKARKTMKKQEEKFYHPTEYQRLNQMYNSYPC